MNKWRFAVSLSFGWLVGTAMVVAIGGPKVLWSESLWHLGLDGVAFLIVLAAIVRVVVGKVAVSR